MAFRRNVLQELPASQPLLQSPDQPPPASVLASDTANWRWAKAMSTVSLGLASLDAATTAEHTPPSPAPGPSPSRRTWSPLWPTNSGPKAAALLLAALAGPKTRPAGYATLNQAPDSTGILAPRSGPLPSPPLLPWWLTMLFPGPEVSKISGGRAEPAAPAHSFLTGKARRPWSG